MRRANSVTVGGTLEHNPVKSNGTASGSNEIDDDKATQLSLNLLLRFVFKYMLRVPVRFNLIIFISTKIPKRNWTSRGVIYILKSNKTQL